MNNAIFILEIEKITHSALFFPGLKLETALLSKL
jgi:hypothetical protein